MRLRVRGIWLGAGVSTFLASCGGGVDQARLPPVDRSVPRQQSSVPDDPVKVGQPYTVGGVTYTPQDSVNYDEVGQASWYGEEQQGNDTANGERFLPGGVSAAHRTLPLPSYVEVTALDTGRTILVRVNDRGPFSGDRLIDLSRGAAEQLGITGHGSTPVRVRRVNPPEQERAALRSGGRAAERLETPAPLLAALRKRAGEPVPMASAPKPLKGAKSVQGSKAIAGTTYAPPPSRRPMAKQAATPPLPQASPSLRTGSHVAQVAAFSSRDRAETLARRIGAAVVEGRAVWRVRLGPYPSAEAARRAATSKGFAGAQIMANDTP
ncbi:septal ring lytic transglycosylase RlpA family protein [Sphingobium aromaticiconvertens]|uniref:septal ring lytic transglycosylase RlpA family protein n=1 Tax=Sphingobium aromaticiconvertens TaxID=365341 RepID=UPI00301642E8